LAFHPALAQQHDLVGQPRHFIDGMADIEHRHPRLVAQPFQVRQDFGAAGIVERGQGLIQQQDVRRHQQRPAQGHARFFPAR
jgi:hypothetical protein